MATAPMTTNGTLSDRIGDWFSHEAIDFLDSLGTEIDCRVEAFAAKVSDRVREAALQMAHAGVTTLLIDRGVRPTPTPETDAPTQNVLQLPTQRGGTPKGAAPAAPTASPAAAGTRAPRAPREGGIAAEIKAHLAAHPGETFTASAIAKALPGNRSSGAVDAAAKRMTERGELAVAGESPRRYTLPEAAH